MTDERERYPCGKLKPKRSMARASSSFREDEVEWLSALLADLKSGKDVSQFAACPEGGRVLARTKVMRQRVEAIKKDLER